MELIGDMANEPTLARPHYVVGIGASAGGLEALQDLITHLPIDSGICFVVVQHLTPDFKSLMNELLARHTDLAIHNVEQDMPLARDAVYLIPAGKMMTVKAGRFDLTDRDANEPVNLPIDTFFISLAEDFAERSIGIVLSGTGSDGSRGIKAIHEAGGLVLAQDLDSARFDGMPRSAIATGTVDEVLVPSAMPEAVQRFIANNRRVSLPARERQPAADTGPFVPIVELVNRQFGVDFSRYKSATVSRRIERRMALKGLLGVDDYIRCLEENPDELSSLYGDLLIGVTEFFRGKEAWESFAADVLPGLCELVSEQRELRCWVAGTATGEEAYSLAILLHEHLIARRAPVNVRIFATDLDSESLDYAAHGIYTASRLTNVAPARVSRYFSRIEQDRYQVSPEIRSMVVFAKHDLTTDPPFTKLDLIVCRNVIIYFNQETQSNAIAAFHFALNLNGLLFLGPSENVGELSSEFLLENPACNVLAKRTDSIIVRRSSAADQPLGQEARTVPTLQRITRRGSPNRNTNILKAYDKLLDRFAPDSLLVEGNGHLVQTFGKGSIYLRPPAGVATLDVLELINQDLQMAVSTGLRRALRETGQIRYAGIRVRVSGDDERIVRLTVEALGERGPAGLFLIAIEEAESVGPESPRPESAVQADSTSAAVREVVELAAETDHGQRVAALKQELRYTKEYLLATKEELQTSNEELQSTNEELLASNEELQSTNEELHSVNEELYSVNREYETKIGELTVLTDDMNNFLVSSDVGAVFLDQELRIRRFTPAVARHFNLMHQDLGRPVTHLTAGFQLPDLEAELRKVLETGEECTHDVCSEEDRWYQMRLHPYRLETGGVAGAVLTFADITAVKRADEQLAERNRALQDFLDTTSHNLLAPVRTASGFARLLAERYGNAVDQSAQEFIGEILSSTKRLKGMLEGLLQHSRVLTRGTPLEETDFYDVVGEARDNLRKLIDESGARIETRLLPNRVMVDRDQMVWLVQELITNSIRFRSDNPPEIRLDAEVKNDVWRISFTDNGIGVDKDHRENMFTIFSRHAPDREASPGFGTGLAIAQRIAERHGGTLTCDDSASGTRIVLELPTTPLAV